MNKFLKNCFEFIIDFKNPGSIKIITATKKIAGIICSNPILNFSKSL